MHDLIAYSILATVLAGVSIILSVKAVLKAADQKMEVKAREDDLQAALNEIARYRALEREWWKANAAILGRWQEEKDLRVKIEQGFERYQMEHPHEGKAN
jgi:hypothetical protein